MPTAFSVVFSKLDFAKASYGKQFLEQKYVSIVDTFISLVPCLRF
jgi:hypothetical protein